MWLQFLLLVELSVQFLIFSSLSNLPVWPSSWPWCQFGLPCSLKALSYFCKSQTSTPFIEFPKLILIFRNRFNVIGFLLFLFVSFFYGLSTGTRNSSSSPSPFGLVGLFILTREFLGSWICLQLVSILRAGKSLVLEKILFGSLMFSSSILTWAAFHISGTPSPHPPPPLRL